MAYKKLETVTKEEMKTWLGKIVINHTKNPDVDVLMEVITVHKKKTVNGDINLTIKYLDRNLTKMTDTRYVSLRTK
jgi:hypothetical protein